MRLNDLKESISIRLHSAKESLEDAVRHPWRTLGYTALAAAPVLITQGCGPSSETEYDDNDRAEYVADSTKTEEELNKIEALSKDTTDVLNAGQLKAVEEMRQELRGNNKQDFRDSTRYALVSSDTTKSIDSVATQSDTTTGYGKSIPLSTSNTMKTLEHIRYDKFQGIEYQVVKQVGRQVGKESKNKIPLREKYLSTQYGQILTHLGLDPNKKEDREAGLSMIKFDQYRNSFQHLTDADLKPFIGKDEFGNLIWQDIPLSAEGKGKLPDRQTTQKNSRNAYAGHILILDNDEVWIPVSLLPKEVYKKIETHITKTQLVTVTNVVEDLTGRRSEKTGFTAGLGAYFTEKLLGGGVSVGFEGENVGYALKYGFIPEHSDNEWYASYPSITGKTDVDYSTTHFNSHLIGAELMAGLDWLKLKGGINYQIGDKAQDKVVSQYLWDDNGNLLISDKDRKIPGAKENDNHLVYEAGLRLRLWRNLSFEVEQNMAPNSKPFTRAGFNYHFNR